MIRNSGWLGRQPSECGIPESSIYLCGVEQVELLLKTFPDIPAKARLDPVDCPLIVSPAELAEVVAALALHQTEIHDTVNHRSDGAGFIREEERPEQHDR